MSMSEKERIWVVDRIEGEAAVLVADDDQEMLDIPLNVLPHGVREGTVLFLALLVSSAGKTRSPDNRKWLSGPYFP